MLERCVPFERSFLVPPSVLRPAAVSLAPVLLNVFQLLKHLLSILVFVKYMVKEKVKA